MGKSRLVGSSAIAGGVATTAGATQYLGLGCTLISVADTEPMRSTRFYTAGTMTQLFARLNANSSANPSTITVSINEVGGNNTVSIGAGATGVFEDLSGSDSIAENDLLAYEAVTGAGGTLSIVVLAVTYDVVGQTMMKWNAGWNMSLGANNTTRFIHPCGEGASSVTAEASARLNIETPGIVKDFYVYVSSNARTSDCTMNARLNGGTDSTFDISIGAGATGSFEDLTGEISLAEDDLFGYVFATGAGLGESIIPEVISCEFIATAANKTCMATTKTSGYSPNAGVTNYISVGGALRASTVNTQRRLTPRLDWTARKLQGNVTANTIDAGNSTVTLTKASGDTALQLSIAFGATGIFEDLTDDVSIDDEESELQYTVITSGTTGSMTFRDFSIEVETPSDVVANPLIAGSRSLMGAGR